MGVISSCLHFPLKYLISAPVCEECPSKAGYGLGFQMALPTVRAGATRRAALSTELLGVVSLATESHRVSWWH